MGYMLLPILQDCQSNLSCLVNFVSNQENATTNSRIESCSSACWNQHNGSMEYNILNISITAINTVDIGESKSCDLGKMKMLTIILFIYYYAADPHINIMYNVTNVCM